MLNGQYEKGRGRSRRVSDLGRVGVEGILFEEGGRVEGRVSLVRRRSITTAMMFCSSSSRLSQCADLKGVKIIALRWLPLYLHLVTVKVHKATHVCIP